jgi:hypothetical protein
MAAGLTARLETAGIGVHTGAGFFELVLAKDQRTKFDAMNGRVVLVTGKKITLSGIETVKRPAIEVKRLSLPTKLESLTGTLIVAGPAKGGNPARVTLRLANDKSLKLIVSPELRRTLGKLNKKTVRVSGINTTVKGDNTAGHPGFVVEKLEVVK